MATITQLREAIAQNIKDVMGDDVQVLRNPRANITPPCVYVARERTEFDYTNARGTDLHTFRVEAYVATGSDAGAQDLLDRFCAPDGDRSLKAAIESDSTLGGLCQDLRVTEIGPDAVVGRERGSVAVQYVYVDFTVEVYADGR